MDDKMVFTTRFVIEDRSEVVYVIHDKDDDWQFFSKEESSEQDARIVLMNEILEIDSSLKEILWIPEGIEAWRDGIGKEWRTKVTV